jgi:hypothetical protein
MTAALERPFYFVVVLWGERFRDYFLHYCLPSLLAPGNLPTLATRQRSKFLIATTPADWAVLRSSPVVAAASRYVDFEPIDLPPCPPQVSACDHMSQGHREACDVAFAHKAYVTVLTPDCMLSDGSIARLQELARSGCQLVVAAAMRFSEEKFLGDLRAKGLLPASGSDAPVVINGRQMAHAAVNGLHSQTLAFAWNAPGFLLVVPAAWWRVPGEDGILLHSLSFAPLLLDYAAIPQHDTSTLDQWTLDGDYLYNNTQLMDRIHVVQDSDEMFIASWAPEQDRPVEKRYFPLFGELAAKLQFSACYKSTYFDPLKRHMFFLPVRWHGAPLNAKWQELEARAQAELRRYVA